MSNKRKSDSTLHFTRNGKRVETTTKVSSTGDAKCNYRTGAPTTQTTAQPTQAHAPLRLPPPLLIPVLPVVLARVGHWSTAIPRASFAVDGLRGRTAPDAAQKMCAEALRSDCCSVCTAASMLASMDKNGTCD